MDVQASPRSSSYGLDSVQFAMPVFFCHEEDQFVSIDVMRVGKANGRCAVQLSTQDGSARDGVKFHAKSQRVVFERGELMKTVDVKLMDDHLFDTTLEFEVVLASAEDCVLGSTLRHCRVLIDDDDLFPDTRFKDVIAEGEDAMCREVNGFLLAYIQLVFLRVPSIWWKSLITMAIDQLHNLYYVFTVCVRVYLVDVVLSVDVEASAGRLWIPGSRNLTAVVLAFAYVTPSFLLMLVDRLKEGPLEMGKAIRTHFKVNLFRKYMNCTDDAKHAVPVQDMVGAMDSDIPALVDSCYMLVFELCRELGKVLIVGTFLLTNLGFHAIVPLLIFPCASFLFLRSRQYMHVKLEDEVIEAEEDATGMLVNSVQGFRLIRDYRQRSSISITYEEKLQRSYEVLTRLSVFKFWNHRFLPTVTFGGVALFLTLGTQLVLTQVISLGAFIASVDMYQHLGDRFGAIQEHCEKVSQSGSALLQITKILNLPTDFDERQKNAARRRQLMSECLSSYVETGVPDGFPNAFDAMPILLDRLSVAYVPALTSINASVALGKLVFIYGQQGGGKRTLLQCIADRQAADAGHAVYASHNRVLQVSPDHVLLEHLSLYENLSFGSTASQPDRVMEIFLRIGLAHNADLLAILQDNIDIACGNAVSGRDSTSRSVAEDQQLLSAPAPTQKPKGRDRAHLKWQRYLSAMETQKIHLVRALVYNPQILVLHKPVDNADAGTEHDDLLGLLREYVDSRGIAYSAGSAPGRRPRTCFFSGGDHHARSDKNASASDVVWALKDGRFSIEKGAVSRTASGSNSLSRGLSRGNLSRGRSLSRMCSFDSSELESQWEGGKVRVATWETTRTGVVVRDLMSDNSPEHRVLKLGAHVRGRHQADWLALSGEKGFVRISMATEEGVEQDLRRVHGEHAAAEIEYEDSGVQCSLAEAPSQAAARPLSQTGAWEDLASRGVPDIEVRSGPSTSRGTPREDTSSTLYRAPDPPKLPPYQNMRESSGELSAGPGGARWQSLAPKERTQESVVDNWPLDKGGGRQPESARSGRLPDSARSGSSRNGPDPDNLTCVCLFNRKHSLTSLLTGKNGS